MVRSSELERSESVLMLLGLEIKSVLSMGSLNQSWYITQLTRPHGVDLRRMEPAMNWVAYASVSGESVTAESVALMRIIAVRARRKLEMCFLIGDKETLSTQRFDCAQRLIMLYARVGPS